MAVVLLSMLVSSDSKGLRGHGSSYEGNDQNIEGRKQVGEEERRTKV